MTGRRSSGTFLALPHTLINSSEFATLSGNATKMLLEIARQYDGRNNGNLSAAWSQLQQRGWVSKDTVHKAITELRDAQFIVLTRQGGKHKQCSLFAITWKAIDDCGDRHHARAESTASNLWKTEAQVAMRTSQVAMRTANTETAPF